MQTFKQKVLAQLPHPTTHVLHKICHHRLFLSCFYSDRKASIGSTLAARQAGFRPEATAAIDRAATAPKMTTGSYGLSPNNSARTARMTMSDSTRPVAIPAPMSARIWYKIIQSTAAREEPRANRIPISPVRRVTMYDI